MCKLRVFFFGPVYIEHPTYRGEIDTACIHDVNVLGKKGKARKGKEKGRASLVHGTVLRRKSLSARAEIHKKHVLDQRSGWITICCVLYVCNAHTAFCDDPPRAEDPC